MFTNIGIAVILISLFFLISKNNDDLRLIYILFLSVFLEFFINRSFPSSTPMANIILSLFVMLILPVYYFFIRKKKIWCFPSKSLIVIIFITLIYLLTLSLFRTLAPLLYLNNYRLLLHGILLFFISNSIFKENSLNLLVKYLFVMFILLFALAVAQHFGPQRIYEFFAFPNSYTRYSETISPMELSKMYTMFGRPINTVFARYNVFGNFIGVLSITLVVIHLQLKDFNLIKKKILIILLIGLFCVLVSGNKVALMSFLFGVLLLTHYINKKIAYMLLLIGGVLFATFYTTLVLLGYSSSAQLGFNSPIQRMMGLFVLATNPFDYEFQKLSTFGLSIKLIPDITQNPIFGVGKYFRGGYIHIFPGSHNVTDATLFFYTAEYGLIGISLIIALFYYAIYQLKKYCIDSYKLLRIIFIVLLLQTITDSGLFYRVSSYLFFITASAFWAFCSKSKIVEKTKINYNVYGKK